MRKLGFGEASKGKKWRRKEITPNTNWLRFLVWKLLSAFTHSFMGKNATFELVRCAKKSFKGKGKRRFSIAVAFLGRLCWWLMIIYRCCPWIDWIIWIMLFCVKINVLGKQNVQVEQEAQRTSIDSKFSRFLTTPLLETSITKFIGTFPVNWIKLVCRKCQRKVRNNDLQYSWWVKVFPLCSPNWRLGLEARCRSVCLNNDG